MAFFTLYDVLTLFNQNVDVAVMVYDEKHNDIRNVHFVNYKEEQFIYYLCLKVKQILSDYGSFADKRRAIHIEPIDYNYINIYLEPSNEKELTYGFVEVFADDK